MLRVRAAEERGARAGSLLEDVDEVEELEEWCSGGEASRSAWRLRSCFEVGKRDAPLLKSLGVDEKGVTLKMGARIAREMRDSRGMARRMPHRMKIQSWSGRRQRWLSIVPAVMASGPCPVCVECSGWPSGPTGFHMLSIRKP